MPPLLSAQQIVKHFGGVTALADGSLAVSSGEVLALMGANGSGKSTLGKIISGAVVPNSGQLLLDGQPATFGSPQAARRQGIAAVYQELSLVPDMTVAENIWLAHEPRRFGFVQRREVIRRTAQLLDLFAGTTSPNLRPEARVVALSPDERQIVEILKALSADPRLIILDEATASLDSRQVARVFELVAGWKARGMAVVFVSHRMDEVFQLADRATVLRSGRTVGSVPMRETNEQALVAMMIEGAAEARRAVAHAAPAEGSVRLAVSELRAGAVRGVSLEVRDGELLGIGGLRGQGQSDLLLALFGAVPSVGSITLGGEAARYSHPQQAMSAGVAFVPGDRGSQGLLPVRSIGENLLLPSWQRYGVPLRIGQARADALAIAKDLHLVMGGLDQPVSTLSGGNAQKVVLGKWLLRSPRLLLLDDPTKGVDVGAKAEFYTLLAELRAAGTAIILYSSDDQELLDLCDRVLVLHDGRVSAELAGEALNHTALVTASMGTINAER